MTHPYIPPTLPAVINERIDAIQADIRWSVVAQQTRDTLRNRFGSAGHADVQTHPGTSLYRALVGHHVKR